MTIRPATLDELPRIVAMGLAFLRSTPYHDLLHENPEKMGSLATWLITSEDGLLLVAEEGSDLVGMIGLLVFAHHLSGERVAGEMFWWVEPSARGSVGVRLFRAAEAWALSQHVAKLQMVAPNPKVGKLYERFGYTAIETAYQKAVA